MSSILHNQLCDDLGAEVPIFGFTHSLDAVLAALVVALLATATIFTAS